MSDPAEIGGFPYAETIYIPRAEYVGELPHDAPPLDEATRSRIMEVVQRHVEVSRTAERTTHLLWDYRRAIPEHISCLFPDLPPFESAGDTQTKPTILSKRRGSGSSSDKLLQEYKAQQDVHARLFIDYGDARSGLIRESALPALVDRRNELVKEFEKVSSVLTGGLFAQMRSAMAVWVEEGLRHAHESTSDLDIVDLEHETHDGAFLSLVNYEMDPRMRGYYVELTARTLWDHAIRGARLPALKEEQGWLSWFYTRGAPFVNYMQGSFVEELLRKRDAVLDDIDRLAPELLLCDRFVRAALTRTAVPILDSVLLAPENVIVPKGIFTLNRDEIVQLFIRARKTGMNSTEAMNETIRAFEEEHGEGTGPSERTIYRYLRRAGIKPSEIKANPA